jgi:hypothetical protein
MSTILHTGRGIYWPQNLPASGYSVRKCQAPNSVSVSAYGILTVSKYCELNHHKSESVLYKQTSRMEVRHTLGVLLWSLPLTVLRICDLFCAIERSKGGGSQPCAWALWADSLWKASALTWFCQWPCGRTLPITWAVWEQILLPKSPPVVRTEPTSMDCSLCRPWSEGPAMPGQALPHRHHSVINTLWRLQWFVTEPDTQ